MSARPYHRRFHSDALAGFMSLTLEERGAYQTLLDMMYDRQAPVLDNDRLLAGYMQVSVRKWRALRDILIAKGKIHVTADGHLSNSRFEKEIENDAKTSRKRAESGSKGGRAKADTGEKPKKNSGGEVANGKQTPGYNHSPESRVQKGSDPNGSGETPVVEIDPVKAVFDLGVALLVEEGSTPAAARSFIGRLRKEHRDGDVLEALKAARLQGVTDAKPWLVACLQKRSQPTAELFAAIDRMPPREAGAAQ